MTNLVQFPGLGLSFEINRVALSIGGFNIYWYGVCIAFGICLALVFAFRHSIEFGVDPDSMVDVILIGIVLGIASARAYYVAMAPFKYESIWEMIAIRDGGLAIYGGVIAAVLTLLVFCKGHHRRLSVRWLGLQTAGRAGAAHVRPDRYGFSAGTGLRPLGQLLQSGGLWLQHHPAVGHVQRNDPRLPDGQHSHGPERRDH